jgi:hypothetical protein
VCVCVCLIALTVAAQVLMDVYNKLGVSEENLRDASSEAYVMTIRGRWCFLPALSVFSMGRWQLPKAELLALATSVRKVARVLWALHAMFQEVKGEGSGQGLSACKA